MAMKTGLSCCFVGVAFIMLGCRSTAKLNSDLGSEVVTSDVSKLDKPAPPWETLTFIHRPEFQEGTGPMDTSDVPEFSATDSGLRYRILNLV